MVYITFECGQEDRIFNAGKFDFAQLTYNELRIGPDGDTLARYYSEDDEWIILPNDAVIRRYPHLAAWRNERAWFSDVIIGSDD